MTRKMQPFCWYGGKYRMFNFLLLHMPKDLHHFVDVFGGSGVVLLNRKSACVDTYNDLDGDLVNFFRVLRDDGDALIRLLELTPYSREELAIACDKKNDSTVSDLERARMFYCRCMFMFAGRAQSASASSFSYAIRLHGKKEGISNQVSPWLGHIDRLPEIIQRLRKVQIENRPAIDILKRFDYDTTFFYLDPPYVHSTRSEACSVYKGEMSDADHIQLAERLHSIKGKAMVSGYKGDLYDKLFSDWRRVDEGPKYSRTARADRKESIWMNYEAEKEVGDLF